MEDTRNYDLSKPLDILSEAFADFACDEVEEFDRVADRTDVEVVVEGNTIRAVVLGWGSSYDGDRHDGHVPGTRPNPAKGCPACRWADVAILRPVSHEGDPQGPSYFVATMGKSRVGQEVARIKTVWTSDALTVLRCMTVTDRGSSRDGISRPRRKIPLPNAAAFRSAAAVDDAIRAVLTEYADAVPDPANVDDMVF